MKLFTDEQSREQWRLLLAGVSPETAQLLSAARNRRERAALAKPPNRPLCGAKTRAGGTCKAKVCARPDGQGMAKRCRLHGGATPCKSKSPEGRAAIAAANRTRAKSRKTVLSSG